MEKEFVNYDIALEMKQLGFDEPCFTVYNEGNLVNWWEDAEPISNSQIIEGYVTTPTFSQCFRWFRDVYGLNHEIPISGSPKEYYAFVQNYSYGNNGNRPSIFTYEEAEIECIKMLIEIVKENKK